MSATRTPAKHYAPLAVGAPEPFRQLPVRLERMIHFVPPHNDKIRARLGDMIGQVDVVLGNLEDAIPADAKTAARQGFIDMAKAHDYGQTGLWTRINALNSPWALDDILEIVPAVGAKLDVIMLPKVEGPWDIHYLDQLLAQLEAKHALTQANPHPRHPGDGGGRQQRGGHRRGEPPHARDEPRAGGSGRLARHENHAGRRRPPGLRHPRRSWSGGVRAPVLPAGPVALHAGAHGRRLRHLWHQGLLRAVRRLRRQRRVRGAVPQRLPARLRRRLDPAPGQIDIAKRVFSLDPEEVAFAKRIVEAMPDGTGAAMIDGKMQDDATWKQAKVILDLARLVATKDPERKALYGL